MKNIIVDTMDYNEVKDVLRADFPLIRHKLTELNAQYSRMINKAKPKGRFALKPQRVESKAGFDWYIIINNPSYTDYKKSGAFYCLCAFVRLSGGLYMFLDVTKDEKNTFNIFTPHFFQRYKERVLQDPNAPTLDAMLKYFKHNARAMEKPQEDTRHANGVFIVSPECVGLGISTPEHTEIKTCLSLEMLRGEQIPMQAEQIAKLLGYIEQIEKE